MPLLPHSSVTKLCFNLEAMLNLRMNRAKRNLDWLSRCISLLKCTCALLLEGRTKFRMFYSYTLEHLHKSQGLKIIVASNFYTLFKMS